MRSMCFHECRETVDVNRHFQLRQQLAEKEPSIDNISISTSSTSFTTRTTKFLSFFFSDVRQVSFDLPFLCGLSRI